MRVLLGSVLLLAGCASAPPAPAAPLRLGSTLWQEEDPIAALAVSPDGTLLATGNAAGEVLLRDAKAGAVLFTFPDHERSVRALAFSPDGRLLASVGDDHHLVVRRVEDGGRSAEFLEKSEGFYGFAALAFSPDGTTLAAGGFDAGHILIDPATGVEKGRWNLGFMGVCGISWSPDGKTVLAGCGDGSVRVVEAATGKVLRTHKDPKPAWSARYQAVGFLDGGRSVIAVRVDGLVDRWAEDGSGGRTLDEPEAKFPGGALSPKGDLLVVAARDGTLRRIDPATGKEIGRIPVSRRALLCAAFLPGGERVVCAGEDGAIRIVDAASGAVLAGPKGHLGPVYCVAASPDTKRVVTGGRDGTARLWDAATGKETALLCSTAGPIYAVAFSEDGKTVAAGGWDGFLRKFDAATGAPVGDPVDFGDEVRRILPGLVPAGPGEAVTGGSGPWRILEDGTVGTMGK